MMLALAMVTLVEPYLSNPSSKGTGAGKNNLLVLTKTMESCLVQSPKCLAAGIGNVVLKTQSTLDETSSKSFLLE